MNKVNTHRTIFFFCICIVVLFSVIALVVAISDWKKTDGERGLEMYAITKKETALKIGRALLEERFPTAFID